jgi:hypothetical protein
MTEDNSWKWLAAIGSLCAGGAAYFYFTQSSTTEGIIMGGAEGNTTPILGSWKWYTRPTTTNLEDTTIWTAPIGQVQSYVSNRSSAFLDLVIDQFHVDSNPRYARRSGSTYCNIFAQDVMRALNIELPWGNANALADYLGSLDGKLHGWSEVNASDAQNAANRGQPSLASVLNSGGTGHIQVVRPGNMTTNGPIVAQAGASNFSVGTVLQGMGTTLFPHIKYYANA